MAEPAWKLIPCPTCGAAKGKNCFWVEAPERYFSPPPPHHDRKRAAKETSK